MDTASWTKVVQPKDFVHVWTCQGFSITHPLSLESPYFKDGNDKYWKLRLFSNPRGHSLTLHYHYDHISRASFKITPILHFLDTMGKIFEPNGWEPGAATPVSFGYSCSNQVTIELPFDLSHQLILLLHNGNLRIQVRFVKELVHQTGVGPLLEEEHDSTSTFISDFSVFFQNVALSDFTIRSGTEEFPVHKVVLAARSPFFRAMLEAPMKEAACNCVKIDNFGPEVVKGMLKYIYSDDVTVVNPKLATEFLQISDYYNLDNLKVEAETVLAKNITKENAVEVVKYAIIFRLNRLKFKAIQFIVQNNVPVADHPDLPGLQHTNLKDFLELLKATGGK